MLLLLLLSHFSPVRLCVTPWMAAHQAPPSLGFSRQEHWSGLPFRSQMHESEKWKGSRSVVSDFSDPMDCSTPGSSIHGIFQARVLEWGAIASIIILNVNGLNAPTKRHRLAEWIQKQDSYICSLQETHFRPQDTYRLKVRGWKNIFHANGKQKKAGVAIFISDKIDLKDSYKR